MDEINIIYLYKKLKSFFEIIVFQITTRTMNSIMNLYKVIGLNITSVTGNSYETSPYNNKILHDKTGKGITKQQLFTTYIIYISLENEYHAIHLSESHCASSRGKLSTIGSMIVKPSRYEEAMSNITHLPLTPIEVKLKLYEDEDEYEDKDNLLVSLDNDPDTCVFKFSYHGNDERNPFGFVYVNMSLFMPK
jgi:hypothetical protein